MEYKASMDTLTKIITAVTVVIFIVIIYSFAKDVWKNKDGDLTSLIVSISATVSFIALLVLTWLYAPQSYTLTDAELIINRPAAKRVINRSEIMDVKEVKSNDLGMFIRTFGNGGLFGYYGKFYSSKLGSMTLYTTQRKNRLLITTTTGKKIMISPDDMKIIDELKTITE